MVTNWEREGKNKGKRERREEGGERKEEERVSKGRGEGGYNVVESDKQGKGMELVKVFMRQDWL